MKILIAQTELGQFDVKEIPDVTLEELQNAVGGYIESCGSHHPKLQQHQIDVLVDEEGVLKLLPINPNVKPFFYVGNVLFVGVDGENYVGLTDKQIEYVHRYIAAMRRLDEIWR